MVLVTIETLDNGLEIELNFIVFSLFYFIFC